MHGGRFVLALSALMCAAAPAPAFAASFTKYTIPTAGFTVSAPSTWLDVKNATTAELGKVSNSPGLAATVKLATETDAIRLILADPATGGIAYMTAGAQRVGSATSATVAAATIKQLRRLPALKGRIVSIDASLPAGRASVIRFEVVPPTGAVETIEYMFVRNQVEYVVAFAAPAARWPTYAPLFEQSARSFAFLRGPDLTHVVLSGHQVGTGYRLAPYPQGNSVIGEATLDLCDGAYPSEQLRTGRLQVRYTHVGAAVAVSNEVVTYLPGAAQQALREVTGVARSCARKPVVQKSGATTTTLSVRPLSDPNLLPGAVAVRLDAKATQGKKQIEQTGVVVYQVKGNTLSGVYVFVTKGTTLAQATRVALHAAEQSARNLGGVALVA